VEDRRTTTQVGDHERLAVAALIATIHGLRMERSEHPLRPLFEGCWQ
jgi:hypothetical protein